MSRIDIRNGGVSGIKQIRFADNADNASFVNLSNYRNTEVNLLDAEDSHCSTILVSDIPNLIKALETAYELWGRE